MRRLILLRHGKTVPSVPAGDHARHLSPRGVAEAVAAGLRLSQSVTPDYALVSDARRTRETFDRIVESFGHEIAHRFEPQLYGASADAILHRAAEVPESVENLLVIGHNPGIGELARRLVRDAPPAERRDLDAHFPTSAFMVIRLTAADWSGASRGGALEIFATPGDE